MPLMTMMRRIVLPLFLAALLFPSGLHAQVDEARGAIDRGEYVRAVNILSKAVVESPSADAFLYLGIAYAHMREFQKAEDILRQGSDHFPADPRFHNELADTYLATNDVDKARQALTDALSVDPENDYASDLLANIDMSEGEVQAALRSWNKSGLPIIDDILNNNYLNFQQWAAAKAPAFRPGGVLRYRQWRTTEQRLFEIGAFSNVGIEILPTPAPDHYDADILTSAKTNGFIDLLFTALKGAPVWTTYLDVWNVGNSGVNVNSMYRWNPDRRLAELAVRMPLPLPGLLFLDVAGIWRNEQWDAPSTGPFRFKSTGGRLMLKHIPDYRFEIGGGLEYSNRASLDDRNIGKWLLETSIRLADARYQNRLHAKAFTARRDITGPLEYRGGTVELEQPARLSRNAGVFLDWTLKGGTSRGDTPIDEKFALGVDVHPESLLRGHAVFKDSRYGRAPMGTDFGLLNLDVERRIAVLPLFNTFNLPFINLKWEIFVDAAQTSDRITHQHTKLLVDAGAGLKLETPTHAFNLIYGRSLRDGQDVLAVYVEKRRW